MISIVRKNLHPLSHNDITDKGHIKKEGNPTSCQEGMVSEDSKDAPWENLRCHC